MSDCRCGKPTRDDAYVCDPCCAELSGSCCDRPTRKPTPGDYPTQAQRARVLLHSPTGQKETE